MINSAVILAGGFGTRLKGTVEGIPKTMAPVKGRPFIEYLLDYLTEQGIKKVVMSTGYLSDVVEEHLGNRYKDLDIDYSVEDSPLGTGGALSVASGMIDEVSFFALNGDTLFKAPLPELYRQHNETGAEITIALREVNETSRYGSAVLDNQNKIVSFTEKGTGGKKALINAGIYLINKKLLEEADTPQHFSLEKELFPELVSKDKVYGFRHNAFFIDIGTPKDYKRAQYEF